jgi:hypothetical protein
MIKNFFEHCANGYKMKDGLFPSDIPLMEFTKPGYRITHYSWTSDGVEYTRIKDAIETQTLKLAPNKKYFIVDQDAKKYGHDNLLVLNPDGTEHMRLKNPFPDSEFFRPDAKFEFQETRIFPDKVLAIIAASWFVPKVGRDAEPVYGTFYDCDTWEHSPLKFINSKDL